METFPIDFLPEVRFIEEHEIEQGCGSFIGILVHRVLASYVSIFVRLCAEAGDKRYVHGVRYAGDIAVLDPQEETSPGGKVNGHDG